MIAPLALLLMPAAALAQTIPLVYSTDLFHPHDDPDDHLDLATVFALPDLDIKAILLRPGRQAEQEAGPRPDGAEAPR